MKEDYQGAIKCLSKKYPNIFDLSKIRVVDGDDFNFISNPYGNDEGFSYLSGSFVEDNRKIKEEK